MNAKIGNQGRTLPTRITAQITIEGPAEEMLAAVQRLHGGKRSVSLVVEVSRRNYVSPYHHLPEIKSGQIQHALEKLAAMAHQTVVDDETDRRLDYLIREFGEFTR